MRIRCMECGKEWDADLDPFPCKCYYTSDEENSDWDLVDDLDEEADDE